MSVEVEVVNRKLNRALEANLEQEATDRLAAGPWASAPCFYSLEVWFDDCEVRARVELKGGSQFFISGAFASPFSYDGPSLTLTANYPCYSSTPSGRACAGCPYCVGGLRVSSHGEKLSLYDQVCSFSRDFTSLLDECLSSSNPLLAALDLHDFLAMIEEVLLISRELSLVSMGRKPSGTSKKHIRYSTQGKFRFIATKKANR